MGAIPKTPAPVSRGSIPVRRPCRNNTGRREAIEALLDCHMRLSARFTLGRPSPVDCRGPQLLPYGVTASNAVLACRSTKVVDVGDSNNA